MTREIRNDLHAIHHLFALNDQLESYPNDSIRIAKHIPRTAFFSDSRATARCTGRDISNPGDGAGAVFVATVSWNLSGTVWVINDFC